MNYIISTVILVIIWSQEHVHMVLKFKLLQRFLNFQVCACIAGTYSVARRLVVDGRRACGCVYVCAHICMCICVCMYMYMCVHVYAHV